MPQGRNQPQQLKASRGEGSCWVLPTQKGPTGPRPQSPSKALVLVSQVVLGLLAEAALKRLSKSCGCLTNQNRTFLQGAGSGRVLFSCWIFEGVPSFSSSQSPSPHFPFPPSWGPGHPCFRRKCLRCFQAAALYRQSCDWYPLDK